MGEPARAAVDSVTDIDVDRRPGIDFSHRGRGRIPVGRRLVHGALDRPAAKRPRQVPDQPQARWIADGIQEVKDRRRAAYLLPLVNRIGCRSGWSAPYPHAVSIK